MILKTLPNFFCVRIAPYVVMWIESRLINVRKMAQNANALFLKRRYSARPKIM